MRVFCSWYLRRRAQRGQPFFTTAWQLWWKTVLHSPHLEESGKCGLRQPAEASPGPGASRCSCPEPTVRLCRTHNPRHAGATSPSRDKRVLPQFTPGHAVPAATISFFINSAETH